MNKIKYKDGVYDITNDDYHNSAAISRSQLLRLDKSPYHFWYHCLSGLAPKKEATPAMIIGSAFHTILLEPHIFDKEYAILPSIDRRTNKGKEVYAQFCEFAGDKIVLTQEQHMMIANMARLVSKHEIVTTLLDESVFEKSIYWTDKETGLQFKCRPDIWSDKMVVDVKTTKDSSPHRFMSSAYENGYYLQAAMCYEACQSIGKPFEMFIILAVEKEEPYVPSVFIMDGDALQFGIDQFQVYKKKLKECLETNKWAGYPVQELGIPRYAVIENEGEDNE